MKKRVLVLSGDGMNCERESARAFEEAGGDVTVLHVNEFLANPQVLLDFAVLCIPGGFSFGDELRSGKILAEKLRATVTTVFNDFTQKGGLSLGVCNGFQVLIQLGAFTGINADRPVTLATNDHHTFLDRWISVDLTSDSAQSPWFAGMTGTLQLPIRHKEGRIVLKDGLSRNDIRAPLRYQEPVNGAVDQAAALLDKTGQILGLMPHPEAATHAFLNPLAQSAALSEENAKQVKILFRNALQGTN